MATISKRKTVVTDPEGNKITTKTRKTNILGPKGATKVITKYANPASSGKKRDVQTFSAPKKEVDTSYKTGGATKMKKYAMGGSALRPATDKANRGMYQAGGPKRNQPGYMKSQTAAEKLYDTDPSVRTYTNEYTGAKIPTGPMAYDEYQNAAERAADKRGQAMLKVPGYKTGGMVNSNAKITAGKSATGRSGGTTKAISKTAVKSASPKGKVGGISKAPKKASPVKLAKAKMGGAKGKC